jgi:hypothetical protein
VDRVARRLLVDERTRRHLNICLDDIKQDALLAAELQLSPVLTGSIANLSSRELPRLSLLYFAGWW